MKEEYLYVQEAAKIAGCSAKTLYRRMNDGQLPYKTGKNHRRLIRKMDALSVSTNISVDADPKQPLNDERLKRIEQKLDELFALQERLLALYRPGSLSALVSKHKRS